MSPTRSRKFWEFIFIKRELQLRLAELAGDLQVPGAAVGIYHSGLEQFATYGGTSIENQVPVDEDTLFRFGSTGKTFTQAR